MISPVTKIEIQDIPGVFPQGYIDEYNSDFRVKSIQARTDVIRIDWGLKNQENVFARKLNKYQLKFTVKESIFEGLQNLVIGNNIKVTLEGGIIHDGKMFSPIRSRTIRGTDFYDVTIEYEDKASEKLIYYALPRTTDENLTEIELKNFANDGITPKNISGSWSSIIDGNNAFVLKSKFEPIPEIESVAENTTENTRVTVKRRTNIVRNVRFRGYFTREQADNLHLYLPLVSNVKITYGSDIYNILEKVNPENITRENIAENFYSLEFYAKFEVINYDHFRDN